MPWIELHQNLLRHPKLIRLAASLGIKKQDALWHILSLWLWALDYAESGDLSSFGPAEIAFAAEWPGEPDLFVKSLQSAKWLDDLRLHDWMDYAGRLVEQRAANKKRMREKRAAHVQNTEPEREPHVGGLPNQPNQPDQTKPDHYLFDFDLARKAYPGTKLGLKPEFENFKKKHKNYQEIIQLLVPAIQREKAHKDALAAAGQFTPEWKHFRTWLNNSCWTNEFPAVIKANGSQPRPKDENPQFNGNARAASQIL